MSNNSTRAQCKHCFGFLSSRSNLTLKNHINHLHCEALKTVLEAGQSSMSRDESVLLYNPDAVREQFAGLVIQEGLPFNHFDNIQMTRVFQNHLQPKYNHVSRSTLKHDAIKLWKAVKQLLKDSFLHLNASVNITTDVWSAPHELLIESITVDFECFDDGFATKAKERFNRYFQGLYNNYLKYDNPTTQSTNAGCSSTQSGGNPMTNLLNRLKDHSNKRAKNDCLTSFEYERYISSDFISHLRRGEFAGFDLLGFWKAKESMFPILSRIAWDMISVQATSVASESTFSTSGRVLSVRRTRLTPASLEM
nr:zinc finger BED domain-containing protein RICESLEEPER 2-like [Tanacetum cinerariifolium]GEW88037.1 zinc finger BED domain-containing protein RICESLEEPER 2-like [Tanacetum cinerariifolium]